jgi:hypothetical protein
LAAGVISGGFLMLQVWGYIRPRDRCLLPEFDGAIVTTAWKDSMNNDAMTELLDHAIERVRALPPETQDAFARVLLNLAGDEDNQAVYHLTPAEEASLAKSLEQAARGEFATDEQVRAVWAKHGL